MFSNFIHLCRTWMPLRLLKTYQEHIQLYDAILSECFIHSLNEKSVSKDYIKILRTTCTLFWLYMIDLVSVVFFLANWSVGDVNDIINFKMSIFCFVRVKWHWQRDKMVNGGFYQNKGDLLYYSFISIDRYLMCHDQSPY